MFAIVLDCGFGLGACVAVTCALVGCVVIAG